MFSSDRGWNADKYSFVLNVIFVMMKLKIYNIRRRKIGKEHKSFVIEDFKPFQTVESIIPSA